MSDVILISGGSRGLGQAIAGGLLESGCRVATFSRTATPFIEKSSADYGLRFFFQAVDARDSRALAAFVKEAHQQFGRIDALVNNAAVAIDGVLPLSRDADIESMLDINLKASLVLARECSRFMLLQGSGNIVNVASIIALRGFSGLATYAATKAGQLGMTRALARELGPKNIRVNAVAPGYLETDMSQALDSRQKDQIIRRTPLGRLGKAEDVVPVVQFLLSPQSRFMTGQVLAVDGGASV